MHDHENGRICQLRLEGNTFIMTRREIRVRFGYGGSVDHHGLRPRDDKSGIFTMKGVKRLRVPFCHCEEDRMDDAAIHRVSGYTS